jgi:excisionase family DNA binding protein
MRPAPDRLLAEIIEELRAVVREELGHPREAGEREVMSAEQVADFLDLDVDGVREAADRGELPHRRVGRRFLFSRSAIREWLRGSNVLRRR